MFNTYVQSLTTSIGWGGQGGTMNIKLIEDPDPPPHLPATEGKTLKSTVFDDDLEGFDAISNKVGTATYFVYDEFKFGGVLQRMQRAESVSGGRTLDLVLESPSKLMDGVQVIKRAGKRSDRHIDSIWW